LNFLNFRNFEPPQNAWDKNFRIECKMTAWKWICQLDLRPTRSHPTSPASLASPVFVYPSATARLSQV
jgi:hypothetical protein